MSSQLISVKLLFKNKLSVIVLGLYTDVTLEKKLAHLHVVNSMVAEALNSSTFIVFGSDFNENNSGCSVSFKKFLDLDLLNSLQDFPLHKLSIWSNSKGVQKCIDFILAVKNKWRYKINDVNGKVWKKFGDLSLAAALITADDFEYHKNKDDINEI
ncbi:hypothetical protein G9A89_013366 [Geosiphon pyriformis]|nr:hypothetical protein G9A89_013366 [Geosiphon pyriformis]